MTSIRAAGVLVGGAGRRMGAIKPLLPHASGGTFVEHAVAVGAALAEEVVLLGELPPCSELPAAIAQLPTLPDSTPGAGPLAGLRSLLNFAGDGWALLLASDLPLLEVSTPRSLIEAAGGDDDAVAFTLASSDEEGKTRPLHACCALFHGRLLAAVEEELGGRASLQGVLGRARLRAIRPNAEQRRQLTNINTVKDLERLGWSRGAGEPGRVRADEG